MKYESEEAKVLRYILTFVMIYILAMFCIGTLDSCINKEVEKQETRTEYFNKNPYNLEVTMVYDNETGVYYYINNKGGMSPVYNTDGSIKVVDGGDPSKGL